MATHAQNIQNLRDAVYGEQVRGSMIELFEEDYALVKDGVMIGTAISSASDPTTGYHDGCVYINSNSWHMFKLEGTAWSDKGSIEGAQGASVTGVHDNGDGTFYLIFSNGTHSADIATIQGPQGDQGPQGIQGPTGPAGRDVVSILMSGTGKSHPVTATYSDGSTQTVGVVQDGADGTGAGDMTKATYDPNDHGYVDAAAGVTDGTTTLTYATLNNKANKATSLAGYGIADAYTMTQSDGRYVQKPGSGVQGGKVPVADGSSGYAWGNPNFAECNDVSIVNARYNDAIVYDDLNFKFVNKMIAGMHRNSLGSIEAAIVSSTNTWVSLTFSNIQDDNAYMVFGDTTKSGATPTTDKGKQISYRNMVTSGSTLTVEVNVPVNPTYVYLVEIAG